MTETLAFVFFIAGSLGMGLIFISFVAFIAEIGEFTTFRMKLFPWEILEVERLPGGKYESSPNYRILLKTKFGERTIVGQPDRFDELYTLDGTKLSRDARNRVENMLKAKFMLEGEPDTPKEALPEAYRPPEEGSLWRFKKLEAYPSLMNDSDRNGYDFLLENKEKTWMYLGEYEYVPNVNYLLSCEDTHARYTHDYGDPSAKSMKWFTFLVDEQNFAIQASCYSTFRKSFVEVKED